MNLDWFFSFLNLFSMFFLNKSPECPHIVYNEDNEASCCQQEIVKLHNKYRNLLLTGKIKDQPRAKNMPDVSWDKALAEKAQVIARKCKFTHERVEDSRFITGQNLLLKCSKKVVIQANWSEAIEFWFDEHEEYTYPDNATKPTGHYTQLVWADSTLIGCGFTNYKISENDFFPGEEAAKSFAEDGMEYCQLFVCNYGPGGNVLGSPPYEKA